MLGSITKALFIQPWLGPEGDWLGTQLFGKRKGGWRDKWLILLIREGEKDNIYVTGGMMRENELS